MLPLWGSLSELDCKRNENRVSRCIYFMSNMRLNSLGQGASMRMC